MPSVAPTILPFENIAQDRPDNGSTANGGVPTNNLPPGTLTVNQGGDVRLWVHLRDLDAGGPGQQGRPANCLFEYARDVNGDGLIRTEHNELWKRMTPRGEPVGHASSSNPQTALATYYNAAAESEPIFDARPAEKGWTFFDWDSEAELRASASLAWTVSIVPLTAWMREPRNSFPSPHSRFSFAISC